MADEKPKGTIEDDDTLTDKEKHYIRISLIKNVKNMETRRKIMVAAFAHQDQENEDGALESMVYYLMKNKSKIDKYYKMAVGGVLDFEEQEGVDETPTKTPKKRQKGKNKK